jgi:phosphotransferase family enzyme
VWATIDGLDQLLDGCGQPGLPELRELLQGLMGGPAAEGRFLGHSELKPQSRRVFRLRFAVNGHPDTLIVKRLSPAIAHRIELAAKRWLPAAGLGDLGPTLTGSVADRSGACVWHVYDDLGPHGLDPQSATPKAVRAAVEQIARMHTRFAGHPLLGEVRLHCGDLGMHFFRANVKDAVYALDAWEPGARDEALRLRLLQRLDALRREVPKRERLVEEWGGPETLLHGDLWAANVFVIETRDGLQARLIDWDHVAVGPFSYDLSTFLLRFPPDQRQSILQFYRKEVETQGWRLPAPGTLNAIFQTAEYARIVNRIVWPAIALVMDHATWATDALAEVEGWFDQLQPVLPSPVPPKRTIRRVG